MKRVPIFFKTVLSIMLCLVLACEALAAPTAIPGEKLSAAASPKADNDRTHLSVTANSDGFDIYSPAKIFFAGVGYRYGPTIIKNDDGSREIFLAAPGTSGEWDWIMYRHFDPAMKQTQDEKAVLQPTPGSRDTFSTCDPGVTYFGGYYYLGYTSTENADGIDNNVFVARSKNVDGPYEKWNGSGWGGNPEPVVEYKDKSGTFGAGEPSMLTVDGTLYFYYTYATESNDVFLMTADASNENWPAALKEQGVVFKDRADGTDSMDIKYIDSCKKFIAICTAERMSENSSVEFYESSDGKTFTLCSKLKTNIAWYCHNAGIESDRTGHITDPENVMIGYAYGKKWGAWSLRLQTVRISTAEEIDLSDSENPNVQQKNDYNWNFLTREFTGITSKNRIYDVPLSGGEFKVKFKKVNCYTLKFALRDDVTLSGYDSSLISVDGKTITPKKAGSTVVTAEWNGCRTEFLINISD